jgi:signal peptidase I
LWVLGLVLVVIAARVFCFDIRRIPTASMAPTLLGDELGGDRVLVDRVTPFVRAPRRFEMLAFRHPDDASREMVKRVAGLPLEKIRISEGDLFINGHRYKKTPAEIQQIRIPLLRSDKRKISGDFEIAADFAVAGDDGSFDLRPKPAPPGQAPILLRLRRAATDGYELDDGTVRAGENVVFDLQVEAPVRFAGPAGCLILEICDGGDRWVAEIARVDGKATARLLRHTAKDSNDSSPGHVLSHGAAFSWPADKERKVTFTSMDCRLSLHVDGEEACPPADFEAHSPFVTNGSAPAVPRPACVSIGLGGCAAHLEKLAIYRDLNFLPKGIFGVREAYDLGPNQFFLLGDRSFDSQDSRDFGGVDAKHVVGLLRAVVYPLSRSRVFP